MIAAACWAFGVITLALNRSMGNAGIDASMIAGWGRTTMLPFHKGNAQDEALSDPKSWFVGRFLPNKTSLRYQTAVELKWGVHDPLIPEKCERREFSASANETTISILIYGGKFEEIFQVGHRSREVRVTLQRPGDYVIFGPGVPHRWRALGPSVMLTVRSPTSSGREPASRDTPAEPPTH